MRPMAGYTTGQESTMARYRALPKVPSVWWSKRLGKICKLNDGGFGRVVVGGDGSIMLEDMTMKRPTKRRCMLFLIVQFEAGCRSASGNSFDLTGLY